MSGRDALLAEIGITPLWKLRQPAVPAANVAPMAVPEPLVDNGFQPETRQNRSSSASSAVAPAETADPQARAARIARLDWPQLKEAVAGCQACSLCSGRHRTVFGVGDEKAKWMLIGEAPGQEEDRLGEPFVGQAGRLLDSMLAAIDLKRNVNVYIANVLKCRPPGNRNPEPFEVAQCSPHLIRQVELLKPTLIVLMGRFAAQAILETDASIASLRGKVFRYQGTATIVTYHPAYLLRNLPDKAKAWEDLLFARQTFAASAALAAG